MYGFRALMSGAQLEVFKQNPVMLLMHGRSVEGYSKPLETDTVLPIGKWYDIRIDNKRLLAKPDFDDDDEFAVKVQKKVQKGYYNAASVALEPIAVSDEDELKLTGQTGPTITKWSILESSIVDIPACKNALAIRNSAGKTIMLSGNRENEEVTNALKNLIPDNMDKKLMAAKLGLPEIATDAEISTKLAAVLAESNKVTGLEAENTKLKGDVTKLEGDVATIKTASLQKQITDLVDGSIAAKKLTATEREKWVKLATADFDTTKELIDGMKAFEGVENKLSVGDPGSAEFIELTKKSGRELYMSGGFEKLKTLSLEIFKVKYKEYYGVDYAGK